MMIKKMKMSTLLLDEQMNDECDGAAVADAELMVRSS